MNLGTRIYIAGHSGLVGQALTKEFKKNGYKNIITRTHAELDLINQEAVSEFFLKEKPEYVIIAAAKVGGIHANNTYPGEFIFINLAIQNNLIHQSYLCGVKRLLFLGSSCIYPKICPQPIKEEYLLMGFLEPTNRPYALAKIAGLEMCWAYNRQYGTKFLTIMPTNLYGPGDKYGPQNSHVIPALIQRFHEAKIRNDKTAVIWGSGKVKREFLFVNDMVKALIMIINLDDIIFNRLLNNDKSNNIPPIINLGSNLEISINDLANVIKEVVGFNGEIIYDSSKPDGVSQKLLDSSRLNKLGWKSSTLLKNGLYESYKDFKKILNES